LQPNLGRTPASTAKLAWENLIEWVEAHYYQPDTEALATAMSVAMSHYFKQDEPVWLMVLGPPGTGKTSIVVNCVNAMPEVYKLDTLTPNTFLSGFTKGKENSNSYLHNIGTPNDRSGIITMAEFSTFMGMREDSRREVGSQMRRIYDGFLDRATGTGKMEWQGKVTMIVCATPAVERAWAMMRDLGERFMQVRWPRGNGVEQAKAAYKQIGRESEIIKEMKARTRTLLNAENIRPVMTDPAIIEQGVVHLAEMVAVLRCSVEREKDWRREIVAQPEPEGPTRIMKALAQVARGHATLFRRADVSAVDYRIARRLGLDSIPPLRKKVFDRIAKAQDGVIGWAALVRQTEAPPTSVTRCCEDLEALNVLEIDDGTIEKTYRLKEEFRELLGRAAPILEV
jgi:hypothetical protein